MGRTSSYKSEAYQTTVDGAISEGFSGIQELRDEMREIADNMESGNLGHTDKCQRCTEAADLLDQYADEEPEVPEALQALQVNTSIQKNRRKGRSESRAVRCSNATSLMQAAAERIREEVETWQEQRDALGDDEAKKAEVEALEEKISEAEELADQIEDVASNCEGAEFPGMYG